MGLSRLKITFNVDLVDTDTITFDYGGNTYLYTCVEGARDFEEFTEFRPFVIDGAATLISYQIAIFEDYGTSLWTLEKINENILELTSINEVDIFSNASSSENVTFEVSTVEVPQPKKSYYFTFTDIKGVKHRVDIDNKDDNTNKTEIKGSYSIENPSDENILSPLRPKQLTCNLEASTDLTFSDLYTEEERVFKITVTRDSNIIFTGWLSSDGLYENYVTDKWVITLNAIDGLGYLEDISYINEDGVLYSGKQTDIEKLSNVLVKTDLNLGFRTSVNIFYEGLSDVDILDNTYFNAERYYTKDNNEPFNCKQILLSVLEKYNAVITQEDGVWYIYKPHEIFNNADITFYNYDADGTANGTYQKNLSVNLGSQKDNYYPHHINGNQQKSIRRSLGVYKTNLKYGRVFPYYNNVNLNWTDSSNINEWTIVNSSFITPYNNLQGFKVTNAASPVIVATSDTYTVDGEPRLTFQVTYSNLNSVPPVFGTGGAVFNCKIIYTKGLNTYYLTKDGLWTGSDELIQHGISLGEQNFTLTVNSNPLPEEDGDIYIDLYDVGFGTATFPIAIHKITLQTYTGQDEPQGVFYTIEKLVKSTPNTDKVKKLIHGDLPNDTYYSAIYENDEVTNTELWYRKGYEESKPLLRIMIEDRLRMAYKPQVIFEGDVFGYIPFLSLVNVNNVKDKMMCVDWGYNAADNITRLKLIELLNSEIEEINVAYSVTEDYGETVKPTIKS